MFTGLIEEIGEVLFVNKVGNSLKIKIKAKKVISEAKIGDSIATNGVCLTAVEIGNDFFVADAMPETFKRSSMKNIKKGDKVNLEKSITLNTPLGGHLVYGDVDCEGVIKRIINDGNAILYTIEIPEEYMKYIVEKGRATIDGASLTVVSFEKNSFKISIIPHTQEEIILGSKKVGDIVNFEADLIGKYIERMFNVYFGNNQKKNIKKEIKMDFLMENGFV